jgi:hypothetical protein
MVIVCLLVDNLNLETRNMKLYFKTSIFTLCMFVALLAPIFMTGCGGGSGAAPVTAAPAPVTSAPASASPPTVTTGPANKVLGTSCDVETGSFDLTATGFSGTAPMGTATYKYFPCSNLAFIFLPGLAGPSDATSFTAGPLPSFLIPATIPTQEHALNGFDNNVEVAPISIEISAGSSTITYLKGGSTTGWTASGSKGVGLQVVTMFLD